MIASGVWSPDGPQTQPRVRPLELDAEKPMIFTEQS